MVARLSSYEGSAERLAELARGFEQSGQAVRELDGFQGAYLLADAKTGRALTFALWSSPEAAEDSAERAAALREEAAQASDHEVAQVEVYEVTGRIEP